LLAALELVVGPACTGADSRDQDARNGQHRLESQLRAMDVPVRVLELDDGGELDRLIAGIDRASDAGHDLLVVDGRLVAHDQVFRLLVSDPRGGRGVLVRRANEMHGDGAVRLDRGVVTQASSPIHPPYESSHVIAGAIRLTASDPPIVQATLRGWEARLGTAVLDAAVRDAPVALLTAAPRDIEVPGTEGVRAGLRWLARHRVLRGLVLAAGLVALADAAWFSIFVLYVQLHLEAGPFGFGVYLAFGAGGGLAGALLADRLISGRRHRGADPRPRPPRAGDAQAHVRAHLDQRAGRHPLGLRHGARPLGGTRGDDPVVPCRRQGRPGRLERPHADRGHPSDRHQRRALRRDDPTVPVRVGTTCTLGTRRRSRSVVRRARTLTLTVSGPNGETTMALAWLSPEEWRALLEESRFEVEACYGWFDRSPYTGGEDTVWITRVA
jgi:hypothetical protein